MTTLHLKKSISRSPSRIALLLIPLVSACLWALAHSASSRRNIGLMANTGEGDGALQSRTTGSITRLLVSGSALWSHNGQAEHLPRALKRSRSTLPMKIRPDGFSSAVKNTTGHRQHGYRLASVVSKHRGRRVTRPPVLVRFKTTPPATSTRPWVIGALINNTTGADNIALGLVTPGDLRRHGP